MLSKSSARRFALYIPDKDRHGNPIYQHEEWVQEACVLLAACFGGCTRLPAMDGYWLSDEGKLITERTTIIYSYVTRQKLEDNLPTFSDFITRFVTETNQETFGIEHDGTFHLIEDPALTIEHVKEAV